MITIEPYDKGGMLIIVECTDTANDEAVSPSTAQWTLTDSCGNVVNNRYEVAVTPASTMKIQVSGEDLDQDDGLKRIFTIEGTYDSDVDGPGQVYKEVEEFDIQKTVRPIEPS